MEAIHKLKIICPYEIIKIEDIKISCKPNEHGYLYLKCLIDDSINFKYAIEASTEDTIILYEELEDNEKSIIFNGIIENVRTTNENGVYYLELEGASRSSLLDMQKKTRSFQDAQMSYDDLINGILKDYKELGFTQCMSRPMSIEKPLFQYKETDYEFLKRVASLLGLELICDIINSGNVFYFGRPEGKLYELEDEINYRACKDLERYYKARTRGFGVDFDDTDFFYYEVENRQKMDIGDEIYFNQKKLYVNQYEVKLHKGEFIYKYRFCRKDGIWQEKIYNNKIKGISLEGEVLETSGEKVKLHLYIDESQDPSKAAWFYYAPPTGNILYSMPIVGESARLYFQDEIDADPIVTGCIRKNGSTCEAMSDTANRYFATESGNYLDILPGAINIHRSGLNVNLNDENGITFSSSGDLSIGASGSVSLSGGSVSINATSKLLVQKSKSSYISLENEFYGQSNVVYESGSDRESYAAFTDDEPTAGAAEAKKKLEQQLKHADFKERQLMEAMKGSEAKTVIAQTDKSSIPLSGDALRDRDDIEVFDSKKVYKGEYVKSQAGDDEFILGKAYPQGLGSVFVPCDSSAAIDHMGTFENHLQTAGNAAMNIVNQTYYDIQIVGDYLDYGIATLTCDQNGKLNAQSDISSINEEKEKTNKYYRDRATYKAAYDADNSIINLAMAVDGIGGLCSMPEKIASIGTGLNKGVSYGIKIMNGAKLALEGTKRLEISVEGIGAVARSGIRALEAGASISNMMGNSDGVVKAEKVEYGDQYTKGKNSRKELKPNVEYTTPGGHTYSTDELGRIKEVDGTLNKNTAKRNLYDQKVAGREDRLDTDDGGHLIASIFDGSGDLDNLVPMDSTLNRGDWKAMESSWAKALKEEPPKTVEVKISPQYSGESTRPTSFKVKYRIDGDNWVTRRFAN